jgi:transcriptional regulator with XRE-family HTH domain
MLYSFFTEQNFYPKLAQDLDLAAVLVLIQSPYLGMNRIEKFKANLQQCVKRSVRVCVIARTPEDEKGRAFIRTPVDYLVSMGIHVNLRWDAHQKFVVIDEHIVWDGSLNPLSQTRTYERATRWEDRAAVREAVIDHRLFCDKCFNKADGERLSPEHYLNQIGRDIENRRRALGMSQAELAKLTGVTQSVISRAEAGSSFPTVEKMNRIYFALDMAFKPVPTYVLPYLNELLQRRELDAKSAPGAVKTRRRLKALEANGELNIDGKENLETENTG